MKRTPFSRRGGLTRDAEKLVRLAAGLSESGSRVEDRYWAQRLEAVVGNLLEGGNNDALNAALDQLYRDNARAYDALADVIEARAESGVPEVGRADYDFVMIAAPVLSWSRYSIPSGPIPPQVLPNLRVQLQAHVLAADARLSLADVLYSPDQLPRSYVETATLAGRLVKAAIEARDLAIDARTLADTAQFLSDMRYVLGAVVAPRGQPLFAWQEEKLARESAYQQWRTQGGACLQPLFQACALEVLLPDAYHAACRNADRQARPYSLRASVAFLQTTLNVQADALRAVVGSCYDKRLEEYRIAFTRKSANDVLHGVVWPMLDAEDESTDTLAQIESVLRECGLAEVVALEHRIPMEYCDDCGAPLYPDPDGQPVHAEMPEDNQTRPSQLH
jgi:hypothetical protein